MYLSAGQRKILLIARAMLKSPEILLCDEVTSGLDEENREKVFSFLRKLKEKKKISFLWVTHSTEELDSFCDRTISLTDGTVLEI